MAENRKRIDTDLLVRLESINKDINISIGGLLDLREIVGDHFKTEGVKNPGPTSLGVSTLNDTFKVTKTMPIINDIGIRHNHEDKLEEEEREFLRSYVMNGESPTILEGAIKQFGKKRVDELLKRI